MLMVQVFVVVMALAVIGQYDVYFSRRAVPHLHCLFYGCWHLCLFNWEAASRNPPCYRFLVHLSVHSCRILRLVLRTRWPAQISDWKTSFLVLLRHCRRAGLVRAAGERVCVDPRRSIVLRVINVHFRAVESCTSWTKRIGHEWRLPQIQSHHYVPALAWRGSTFQKLSFHVREYSRGKKWGTRLEKVLKMTRVGCQEHQNDQRQRDR